MKESKIIVKMIKTENKSFNSYKLVQENGELIDLRMCQSVDNSEIKLLNDCKKAIIQYDIEDLSINSTKWEFPRAYIKNFKFIKKIY